MKMFAICFLIFHSWSFLFAQVSVRGPRIGVGFSGNTYLGDLNFEEKLHRFYPGLNINIAFETQKTILPSFNLNVGKFIAQTRDLPPIDGKQPNSFVKTNFISAAFLLKIRPFHRLIVSPHLGLGLGILNFTPKNELNQNYSTILSTRLQGESFGSTALQFPLNAGFSVKLAKTASIGFDCLYSYTTTDYLDNIGKLGTQKGNDKLLQFMISFQFVFQASAKMAR